MAAQAETCAPWCELEDVVGDDDLGTDGCRPCTDADLEDAEVETAIAVASDILWRLTAKQFGGAVDATVRPCRRPRGELHPDLFRALSAPSLAALGGLALWGGCGCTTHEEGFSCGCNSHSALTLGAYPINSIEEVKVDGDVLDPSEYAVYDYKWLVRTSGHGWPCCQNLYKPDTEPGTFSVTFNWGVEPPPSGKRAAIKLACELALAFSGNDCSLPERVQTILRQGVTMTILDPQDFLDQGRTGLFEVDLFLKAVNPNGIRETAMVASPDVGPPVRRRT